MSDVDADCATSRRKYQSKASVKVRASRALLALTAFGVALFSVARWSATRLPDPLSLDEWTSDVRAGRPSFSEVVARAYLNGLANLGPRPSGSFANSVASISYLLATLDKMKAFTTDNTNVRMEVDVQRVSGSFELDFIDGLTHHYSDLQNVVVRLSSRGRNDTTGHSPAALLINCHFDSVPDGPGASDDAVSCAAMLHVIEIILITRRHRPLSTDLVFLFNGAEENMLPASHGFVTQHPWAADVRAFVNLEACGSGGRQTTFQLTPPTNSWLMEAYNAAVPYPSATVMGQEIFELKIVPGETDFRIFRDYGRMTGVDLAYTTNGYVYHTRFDVAANVPAGALQAAGHNLLAFVLRLIDDEMNIDAPAGEPVVSVGHNNARQPILTMWSTARVYFDMFGVKLVDVPLYAQTAINLALVFYVVVVRNIVQRDVSFCHLRLGMARGAYFRLMFGLWTTSIFAAVAAFLVATLISLSVDAFGRAMTWYGRPWLVVPLYALPAVATHIAAVHIRVLTTHRHQLIKHANAMLVVESLMADVMLVNWAFALLTATLAALKCAFLMTVGVAMPLVGRVVIDLRTVEATKAANSTVIWRRLAVITTAAAVPLALIAHASSSLFDLFIPIMGRVGSAVHSDLIVGYLTAIVALTMASHFVGLLATLVSGVHRAVTSVYCVLVVVVCAICLTPLGMPYSAGVIGPGQTSAARPQRIHMMHTQRQFHDLAPQLAAMLTNSTPLPQLPSASQTLVREDAGYYIANLDRNSPRTLMQHMAGGDAHHGEAGAMISLAPSTTDQIADFGRDGTTFSQNNNNWCYKWMYCGMPIYYPAASRLRHLNWLPGPNPRVEATVDAFLRLDRATVKREVGDARGDQVVDLTLTVQATDHTSIQVSPGGSSTLVGWSLGDGDPIDSNLRTPLPSKWSWLTRSRSTSATRPIYFVFHSHGLPTDTATTFNVDLRLVVSADFRLGRDRLLDVAVSGHVVHSHGRTSSPSSSSTSAPFSAAYAALLEALPDWMHAHAWTTLYRYYVM